MGISAVILTHNNQATIKDAITSAAFCDETIVVDDESTDMTLILAHKLGATIVSRALGGNFAAQRNFGLSKAAHEWVLFLDADEKISSKLANEIREATMSADVNGFFLRRQDVLWGTPLNHGETQQVRLLRLAKKGKGLWKRPVHEVWNITGVVGTLKNPLQHVPHPKVADFLADINTYSTINAAYLFENGTRASVFQIIAYPTAKFFQNYVLRRGFLDGMPGMIVACMMSFHSFLTRAKLWKLQH